MKRSDIFWRGDSPLLKSLPSDEGCSLPTSLPLGVFSISRTFGAWPPLLFDKSNTDVNVLLQYTEVINCDCTKPSHYIHICNYTMITSTDRRRHYIWVKISINNNIIKQKIHCVPNEGMPKFKLLYSSKTYCIWIPLSPRLLGLLFNRCSWCKFQQNSQQILWGTSI